MGVITTDVRFNILRYSIGLMCLSNGFAQLVKIDNFTVFYSFIIDRS